MTASGVLPVPPAHPRVCGEHPKDKNTRVYLLGSSPRLRGAPVQDPRPVGDGGLIPASAGSTA